MPQVISIKNFYTRKRTSFFTFFLFLNLLPDCTILVSELSNPSFGQNPELLIKKSSVNMFALKGVVRGDDGVNAASTFS